MTVVFMICVEMLVNWHILEERKFGAKVEVMRNGLMMVMYSMRMMQEAIVEEELIQK